ncbi:CPBP family intramembrane glutamic endopeptidase [Haloprofundus salilacus]|uniref:CPBP family intramembrane glutamic endopeptidase n=1 Tax=Haloprofundus salilacus TaxID=2876190 RepID=UPI001CCD2F73|nr:CPBP family intramembrane glutamic endopeptidase [Haloprofundus salilacus]
MSKVVLSDGARLALVFLSSVSVLIAVLTVYEAFAVRSFDASGNELSEASDSREYWDTVRPILVRGALGIAGIGCVVYLTGLPVEFLLLETTLDAVLAALGIGVLVGVGLMAAQKLFFGVTYRFGYEHDMTTFELLSPDTSDEWVLHLGLFLPVVAVYEELVFRVGLIALGYSAFGVDTWTLVAVSAVLFGLAHRQQEWGGVVIMGISGIAFGAVYLWTASLLTVVIAHYSMNVLAFAVYAYEETDPSMEIQPT